MLRHARRGLAAALAAALTAPLVLSTLAVPAVADHTDTPERVTLVGSLQDEIGCDGDWAPGCDDSRLEPVRGASTYEAVFEVPAGSYELKVAINGGWDESYGGGGDGSANIPLNLEHDAELRFRPA